MRERKIKYVYHEENCELCTTLFLMKQLQSLLHNRLKCMVVNETPRAFVLIHETISGDVLPAAAWCDVPSVLNHIATAWVSGMLQTRIWVSHWLRWKTVWRRKLFNIYVYSKPDKGQCLYLVRHPPDCLSVGVSVCWCFLVRPFE